MECSGILVEKGYTKDGAWSGRDFLELGKKYPENMLCQYIQTPDRIIRSQLREYMAAFIDWENMTCSFDDDEFIALLEDLKALGSSYEFAGMPTADGSLKYELRYEQMYGINAASKNKEGAWAFLEYLVEYIQGILSRRAQAGKSQYSQSLYNLKDAAKMLNFLQTNNIRDMAGSK